MNAYGRCSFCGKRHVPLHVRGGRVYLGEHLRVNLTREQRAALPPKPPCPAAGSLARVQDVNRLVRSGVLRVDANGLVVE